MSIETYKRGDATAPASYAKVSNHTERVIKFVEDLHNFLPCIKEEFDDLEDRQAKFPNDKFPIKMDNLAAIYQAAGPLYELYVEKNNRRG